MWLCVRLRFCCSVRERERGGEERKGREREKRERKRKKPKTVLRFSFSLSPLSLSLFPFRPLFGSLSLDSPRWLTRSPCALRPLPSKALLVSASSLRRLTSIPPPLPPPFAVPAGAGDGRIGRKCRFGLGQGRWRLKGRLGPWRRAQGCSLRAPSLSRPVFFPLGFVLSLPLSLPLPLDVCRETAGSRRSEGAACYSARYFSPPRSFRLAPFRQPPVAPDLAS